jgi:hypothetical protein
MSSFIPSYYFHHVATIYLFMDKFGLQGNFSAPTSCFMPIVHMNANPQYISAGAEKNVADCI